MRGFMPGQPGGCVEDSSPAAPVPTPPPPPTLEPPGDRCKSALGKQNLQGSGTSSTHLGSDCLELHLGP